MTLARRQRTFGLTLGVAGNDLHDDDVTIGLGIKPVRGLVAGNCPASS